jgi:DNA-binding NtrC family response regulator
VLERVAHESGMPQVSLTDEGVRLLASHAWPGNVRELENVLRAAALFCEGGELSARELGPHLGAHGAIPAAPPSGPPSGRPSEPRASEPRSSAPSVRPAGAADAAYAAIRSGTSLPDLRRQVERECIVRALAETGGNITRAAALLGMKRPRLSQLAKEYGMSAGKDDEP